MKRTLLIASLVTAAFVGLAPTASATCGNNLDERCTYPEPSSGPIRTGGTVDCVTLDPGAPGGGVLGQAEWFTKANAYLACILAAALQDSALQHGGDGAWKIGTITTGGMALFNITGLTPAAAVYQDSVTAVALSQAYDTCFVVAGSFCGSDTLVDQSQHCPSGVAIPNPVPGSLTGNTLDNSNGLLQATCAFQAAAALGLPDQMQVMMYQGSTQLILLSLNGDVFAIASDVSDAACVFLTGETPCF